METLTATDTSESVDLFASDDVSTTETTANEGSERGSSNEQQTNLSQKGDQTTANNAPTSKVEANSQQSNPEQKKFVTRGERREQEIKASIAENKRLLEEIRRERQVARPQQTQPNNQEAQEPIFVEQPKKPQFTREQIAAEYKKAAEAGDQSIMAAAQEALKEWDKYDTDLKFWKIENGQKIEKFQSYRKHYWNQAVEKVKHLGDLNDSNSEIRREADRLAQQFPEVLRRQSADGEYLIAQLAAMRLERKSHAAEVGALKEQVKQLTEKLSSAQKKVQPASQGVTPKVAGAGEGSTPEERLAQRLEAA